MTPLRSHLRVPALIAAVVVVGAACLLVVRRGSTGVGVSTGSVAVEAEAGQRSGATVTAKGKGTSAGRYVALGAGAGRGFLTRQGATVLLGGQAYRFTGLNIYNAASQGSCWYPMGSGPVLDRSLASIDSGSGGTAKVIRVWFFQEMAVRHGKVDWSAFDHILAVARARGFLVIPTLSDQWGDCQQPGRYKSESWYQSGYRAPDPGAVESYRAWAREVVTRYRSDPTVAMWSLMDEAEDAQSNGGRCSSTAPATLRAFVDDVGAVVKSADPNHLVTLGTIGTGQCGASAQDYQKLYASPSLDVCEYHDSASVKTVPGDQWNGLQTRVQQCNALAKPLVVGEAEIDSNQIGGLATRASLFEAKLSSQFGAGIAGFLAWDWRAADQGGGDRYVIGPGDPTLEVLGRYGMALPPLGDGSLARAPVGRTPPMGFNPYNHFGSAVTEATVRQIADAMVANGMRDAGYVYVNLDDSWQGRRDAAGHLTANSKFPGGIAALALYLHRRGLRLGIYTTPARVSCGGNTGSEGHYQQDVATFASWGVDYIKLDWCNADYTPAGASSIARQWRDAITASGRPMVLSINAGGSGEVPRWAKDTATMWRTSDDLCASWFNKSAPHDPAARDCFDQKYHNGIYDDLLSDPGRNAPFVSPGHWADPDMLEIGNPGLTADEARTHFNLWAMWAAPLLAGNDPRDMRSGDVTEQILLNHEVIAVDQDAEGVMATEVSQTGSTQVWAKPLSGGDRAILLLNTGDSAADVTVDLPALGLSGDQQVRDLWAHRLLGTFSGSYTEHHVAPHASVLLRVASAVPCLNRQPAAASGSDSLRVTVVTSGSYRIWTRVANPSGGAGSYQLRIDGGCPIAVGGLPDPSRAWVWTDRVDGTGGVVDVPLGSGPHTLTLATVQPDVRIDRLILTPDTGCVPTGTGDNCLTRPRR